MKAGDHPRPIPGWSFTAHFDVWSHSAYTSGGPTHKSVAPDDVQLGDLPQMASDCKAKARRTHPLAPRQGSVRITEFSWDSAPPDPGRAERWASSPGGLRKRCSVRGRPASASSSGSPSGTGRGRAGLPYSQTIDGGALLPRALGHRTTSRSAVLKAFRFPFVAFSKPTRHHDLGPDPRQRRPGG